MANLENVVEVVEEKGPEIIDISRDVVENAPISKKKLAAAIAVTALTGGIVLGGRILWKKWKAKKAAAADTEVVTEESEDK